MAAVQTCTLPAPSAMNSAASRQVVTPLWMGVPVLTLAGERSAGRSSASILGALGLDDWVATTPEDYVRLALAHAADGSGLAHLRATLRARLRRSPLMDEAGFARDMESAYRVMWRTWCAQRIT